MNVLGILSTVWSVFTWIGNNWETIAGIAGALSMAASGANALIPPGKPGSMQSGAKQIINAMAIGFGHATPHGLK